MCSEDRRSWLDGEEEDNSIPRREGRHYDGRQGTTSYKTWKEAFCLLTSPSLLLSRLMMQDVVFVPSF